MFTFSTFFHTNQCLKNIIFSFLLKAIAATSEFFSHASHAIGGRATSPTRLTPLAQRLGGRYTIPVVAENTQQSNGNGGLTPPPPHRPSLPITQETPLCSNCERVIV